MSQSWIWLLSIALSICSVLILFFSVISLGKKKATSRQIKPSKEDDFSLHPSILNFYCGDMQSRWGKNAERWYIFLSQCKVVSSISPISSYWVVFVCLFAFVSRMEFQYRSWVGTYYSAGRVVWAGGSCPPFLFCLTNNLVLCFLHNWASVTSELSNKNMNLLCTVCPFSLCNGLSHLGFWCIMYFSHQRLRNVHCSWIRQCDSSGGGLPETVSELSLSVLCK